jgi:cyclophilin family peptidyl-prolyl cis-trans isomerase/HEAT repeat protein
MIRLARRASCAVLALALPVAVAAFAGGPPSAPAAAVSYEQRLSWILRLEDQRILRDQTPKPPAAPVPAKKMRATATPAAPVPDLVLLLTDRDPRIRYRAALAVGRVGLAAGIEPLAAVLSSDGEPEVRQMAAFALGLLRDGSAAGALRSALADASPLVQGRAAEALGQLNDAGSAPMIGALAARYVKAGVLASIAPDDLEATHSAEVEAFRLAVLALGRLKAYEPLAAAVLDASGRPLVRWWPVAFALQRTEDRRAYGPLVALATGDSLFGRSFAARGLGALKDPAAIDTLAALAQAWSEDGRTAISAVRALGQIGDRRAGAVLVKLLRTRNLDPQFLLDVIPAIGATRAAGAIDPLLDLVSHPSPAVRSAVLRAIKDLDTQAFLLMLSGIDTDRDWSVRATLATLLGGLDAQAALPRLTAMLQDRDLRVIPAVLGALVKLKAPKTEQVLLEWLRHDDVVVRSAAAAGLGELKPAGGERTLIDAYHAGVRDASYSARSAVLDALANYGAAAATPTLREALSDKDWAVRLHAATLLKPFDQAADLPAAIRPAPGAQEASFYESPELIVPTVSPHVFIDTSRGTVELELAVVDAPRTCANFVALAARGFFNAAALHRVVSNFVVQDGDPRGDGEGGPGYTIRDEINERPYLRGTLGMALEWADTGGSQFFITHSPQPHLDGRYTVFGRVVSGLEIVDRLQAGDTITRVRVWDGKTMLGNSVQ